MDGQISLRLWAHDHLILTILISLALFVVLWLIAMGLVWLLFQLIDHQPPPAKTYQRGTVMFAPDEKSGIVAILPDGGKDHHDYLHIYRQEKRVATLYNGRRIKFEFQPSRSDKTWGDANFIRPLRPDEIWLEAIDYSFKSFGARWRKFRTLLQEANENRRKLWESREKARLEKEHMEWERAVAEEHRRAHDPVEVKKRERATKVAAIEAEFAAIRPVQPPAKSERFTEERRVSRETSWFDPLGFAMFMIFVPMLGGGLVQSTALSPPSAAFIFFLLLAGSIVGMRTYHFSDGHQKQLRARRYDEDKKWSEEDAAWRAYEAALTQWEQNKQERLLALDALQTDSDGVTTIGRKVINELNL